MGKIIESNQNNFLNIIHNQTGLTIPKPYERDIFLFDTYIAGVSFLENKDDLEKELQVGDTLDFYREPGNEYDANAIMVKNIEGMKIGYVPKHDNIVFARLMDAGKLLVGEIVSLNNNKGWLRIKINIYMKD